MDLTKLSIGDKVMAGSGIALFIFSFFPWYKVDFGGPFGGGTVTQSGWHFFFTGIIPTLLALALVGYVVVTKVLDGIELPELPVAWPLVVLGTAGLAALLVIIRLLAGGDDGGTGVLDRSFGIFLAVLGAIGLAVGAFLKFQEDGGELPTKGGTSSGSSGGPASPF
ncbi:MAG: hypothetical protein ABI239_08385 [Aquihabitans sp.]